MGKPSLSLPPLADAPSSTATSTSASARPSAASGPLALPAPAANAEKPTSYLSMTGDACESELKRRKIDYALAPGGAQGVDRAIRLNGPLHGVEVHIPGARSTWHSSVHEILDCRLALAVDDFAAFLAEKGVTEVLHVSMYRKNAHIAGKKTPSQHAYGRAIDVSAFVKRDGSRLDVLNDWGGAIGDTPCGPNATQPRVDTPAARELRSLVCEASSRGLFHLILTPDFNQAHANHLHMDIEPRGGCEVK
ncbi:MAG: extensin family protein [Polyangiaceae bacterium]